MCVPRTRQNLLKSFGFFVLLETALFSFFYFLIFHHHDLYWRIAASIICSFALSFIASMIFYFIIDSKSREIEII